MKTLTKILIGLLLTSIAMANPQIHVLALFTDKVMLSIDGKRRLLVKGKRSPEGVLLITSNGLRAKVEVDGETFTLTPKSRIGSRYVKPKKIEYRIVRDNSGHFRTPGTINGQPVTFLVDTGATSVAMSEPQARQLGIQYELTGTPIMTRTASGVAKAYAIKLDSVTIGAIRLSNIQGSVIEGTSPTQVLLGMSFLNALDMQNIDNMLLLRQKH